MKTARKWNHGSMTRKKIVIIYRSILTPINNSRGGAGAFSKVGKRIWGEGEQLSLINTVYSTVIYKLMIIGQGR